MYEHEHSVFCMYLANCYILNKFLRTTKILFAISLSLSIVTYIIITGAISISEMIKTNHTLQLLDISMNPMGDEGITFIARTLDNARISKLNVSHCNITVTEAIAVLEAAVANGVCQEVMIDKYKSNDKVKGLMRILEERKRREVGSIITL